MKSKEIKDLKKIVDVQAADIYALGATIVKALREAEEIQRAFLVAVKISRSKRNKTRIIAAIGNLISCLKPQAKGIKSK